MRPGRRVAALLLGTGLTLGMAASPGAAGWGAGDDTTADGTAASAESATTGDGTAASTWSGVWGGGNTTTGDGTVTGAGFSGLSGASYGSGFQDELFSSGAGGQIISANTAALPHTQGWVESWASGSASGKSCNTNQFCITATGSGESKIVFGGQTAGASLGAYNLSAQLVLDSGSLTSNGFGGNCGNAFAQIILTPPKSSKGSLVLDVQGEACNIGNATDKVELTSTYVVDSSSSGAFSKATGTGSISVSTDVTAATFNLAFSGNLHL